MIRENTQSALIPEKSLSKHWVDPGSTISKATKWRKNFNFTHTVSHGLVRDSWRGKTHFKASKTRQGWWELR